jgi:hypothetical protein
MGRKGEARMNPRGIVDAKERFEKTVMCSFVCRFLLLNGKGTQRWTTRMCQEMDKKVDNV